MKEKTPLSVKLESGVHERLEECARRTKIKKYALAILAIEAAVDAIEKNGYRLVVPIEFDVLHKPQEAGTYPKRDVRPAALNEPASSSAAAEDTASTIPEIVERHYGPAKKRGPRQK